MSIQDKNLNCRDCNAEFVFTAGEQEFYNQKGFTNEPTRCPSCRSQRKSGGGNRRGGSGGSGGGGGSREMYSATCSECGKEARVPFVPSGDKPVYCSDCFQNKSSSRW